MKIEKIVAIYAIVLGFVALLSKQYPSVMSNFVTFFFSATGDSFIDDFSRYRMSLYIVATIIFLSIIPIGFWKGFYRSDIEKIWRMHWVSVPGIILGVPLFWIAASEVSMCTTCYIANDIVYFVFVIGNFIGFQSAIQVLILKLTIITQENK